MDVSPFSYALNGQLGAIPVLQGRVKRAICPYCGKELGHPHYRSGESLSYQEGVLQIITFCFFDQICALIF
ncbi:MAG: hypothetical protein V4487_07270 [Chlamydiota bacterium]